MVDAQQTQVTTLPAAEKPTTAWLADSALLDGSRLLIVTVGDPSRTHPCRLDRIDPDKIVCREHRGTRVYTQPEVAALIVPGSRTGLSSLAELCLVSGGITGGLVMLAFLGPWAIAVAALIGLVTVVPAWILGGLDPDRNSPDRLVYLKPGESLSVPLRWQPRHAAASAAATN